MYAGLIKFLKRYIKSSTLFKYGFTLSPMYRRTTGKILAVSEDLHRVSLKIPLSLKNKNYVGSIFGGSLFAATDPIYMIQLIQILGENYVVWDKETTIKFKKPAFKDAYAVFIFDSNEIEDIKSRVQLEKEINFIKKLKITDKEKVVTFSEVQKTIYVADKNFYKSKKKKN